MPDRDLRGPEPDRPDGPDWMRRLLDGYAEPGRVARLAGRHRRRAAGRFRRLVRRVFGRQPPVK